MAELKLVFSPPSDISGEHGKKTSNGAANASRFKFGPNVWKTDQTPANSR